MPTTTILIPAVKIDEAIKVLDLLGYRPSYDSVRETWGYSQEGIHICLYEKKKVIKDLYSLAKKFNPNIEDGKIVLEFTEHNLEEAFSEEGISVLGSIVRSISPNKKYEAQVEDPITPLFIDGEVKNLVKKKELTEQDISQILYVLTSSQQL